MEGETVNQIDQRHAAHALLEAERRRWEAARGGPNEPAIAFSCGVFVLAALVAFDLFPARVAGPSMFVTAGIGMALAKRYHRRRTARVTPTAAARRRKDRLWLAWAAWYVLVVVAAAWVGEWLPLRYTIAGILGALPLLVWGGRGLRAPGWR